jgi:hypothetical protein
MKDPIVIQALQDLVREDLQLGWSHLEDGNYDFALHHLGSAVRKVQEIKQLAGGEKAATVPAIETQSLSSLNDQFKGTSN